jgi:hypothetical protein
MMRIAAGMELDGRGAEVVRPRDGIANRVNEEARPNAKGAKLTDGRAEPVWVAGYVEPTFGRDFLAPFGNERDLEGSESSRDGDHFPRAGHFEVENGPNCCRQAFHVVILNVTTVLAKMCGNAVSAGVLAFSRGQDGVGLHGAARLAKRRDVVDVNVKSLVHCRPNHHLHAAARREIPVKRTILLLLTFAACRSAPTPAPGSAAAANLPGAPAPRLAVERFLGAAKSQDLQEMSIAWGTSKGPARDQFERTELEKRLIVMQGCYDSDKHRIVDEQPADNGKRILRVELTKGTVTKTPRFTTVKGPSDRWYVEDADFAAVTALCRR